MASPLELTRIILGSIYVLLVPGLAWSLVFFPQMRRIDAPRDAPGIDWIERGALSFGLSIALVPLTVFLLAYFFDVPLTATNAVIIVAALTLIPIGMWGLERTGKAPWRKKAVPAAASPGAPKRT